MDATAKYPPLTSLETMPLHSGRVDFDDGGVFGCEAPERPADDLTMWDWRCPGCVLHAAVVLRTQGDSASTWCPERGAEPRAVTRSWLVARAQFWAEERPS